MKLRTPILELVLTACLACFACSSASWQLPPEESRRIEAFRGACPSVVHVEAIGVTRDPSRFNVLEIPLGMGSGFVWDERGHIVTNAHVIAGADQVRVIFRDGSSWNASVMGRDSDHDVAVLMIDAPPRWLDPIRMEPSASLRVGQSVLAIGNPFGLDHTLTSGVISALGREFNTGSGSLIHGAIQTDAAINPGNSGGPLLDSSGRLIGINTALVSPSGAFAGIGFAVPVDTVRESVARILGDVPSEQAGLSIRVADDAWVRELGLCGVLVLEVPPIGPAEQAGLLPTRTDPAGNLVLGDLIVGIDGEVVRSRDELASALRGRVVGDSVVVTVHRGGEEIDVAIALVLERH